MSDFKEAKRPRWVENMAVGLLLRGYGVAPSLMHRIRPRIVRRTWKVAHAWRSALRENGKIILGPDADDDAIDRFGIGVLNNMQLYMAGLVAGSCMSRTALVSRIGSFSGVEDYRTMRKANPRGAVIISIHMGDFESAAAIIADHDAKMNVLYRRDHIDRLERIRARARKRLDVRAHAVDDGMATWLGLKDALGRNEVVALHGDRVQPGQTGTKVNVLGHQTVLPIGPFKLAYAAEAPLVPVFNWRMDSGLFAMKIGAPIELDDKVMRDPENSTAVNSWAEMLGDHIRSFPEQWLNVHSVWTP